VSAQLGNVNTSNFWGAATRRTKVELAHSLNSVVPAMAAWAGLGNGPRMLYRFPGFDRLHVRLFELLACDWVCLCVWLAGCVW